MDRIFDGILGTFPKVNDLKVQGINRMRTRHQPLLETCETAIKAGLRFSPQKCHVKQSEIVYFSNVIGRQGVHPDPKKVKAIQDMQYPANEQEM